MKALTKAELNEHYEDACETIGTLGDELVEFAGMVAEYTGDSLEALTHAREVLAALGDGSEVCPHVLARELKSVGYALTVADIAAEVVTSEASAHLGYDGNPNDAVSLRDALGAMSDDALAELAWEPAESEFVALVQAELAARMDEPSYVTA